MRTTGDRGTLTSMSETPTALGRRIVVTGLAGSGKSTLGLALAAETGLPLIHLDLEFWNPGWTEPSETEFRDRQRADLPVQAHGDAGALGDSQLTSEDIGQV